MSLTFSFFAFEFLLETRYLVSLFFAAGEQLALQSKQFLNAKCYLDCGLPRHLATRIDLLEDVEADASHFAHRRHCRPSRSDGTADGEASASQAA